MFGLNEEVMFGLNEEVMFGLKTEEIGGGGGCVMWSFLIYSACQILSCQRTVAELVRNVACMGVKVILNKFFNGKREGKCPFKWLV
jgi:hypothetical protein